MENTKNWSIIIKNLRKLYPGKEIFNNFNLKVKKGEFFCLLGLNGTGKTTFLKILAGLEEYQGEVMKFSDSLGFISQNPNDLIFPWLTVKKNIIFPLNKKQINHALLQELLQITGLVEYRDKYPYQLSGGMIQLLLIARAILGRSEIILMDEPFKSLDLGKRKKIQDRIKKLWKEYKPTIIMASHDLDEAISLAQRIIIFPRKGAGVGKIIKVNLSDSERLNELDYGHIRIKEIINNVLFD